MDTQTTGTTENAKPQCSLMQFCMLYENKALVLGLMLDNELHTFVETKMLSNAEITGYSLAPML